MRRHGWALAMGAGVGAALLVLLGTLQVRWLDQVAQTITAQKRAALFRRGTAVATELERELTRAFFWFQPDQESETDARNQRTEDLVLRWQGWQKAAPHPGLLSAVWLVQPGVDGQEPQVQRLGRTGGPQAAPWPSALAAFRGLLHDEVRIAGLLPTTDAPKGWLALPVGLPGPPDGSGASVLLEIDGDHLSRVLLPAFTQAHHDPASDGGPLQARLENGDGRPLFSAPAGAPPFRSGEHDPLLILGMRPELATPDLFAGMQPPRRWPPDLIVHRLGPGDSATSSRRGGARTGSGLVIGFGAGPGVPGLLDPPPVFSRQHRIGGTVSAGLPNLINLPPGPFIGRASRGQWQLALAYADGAVDDLVTSLRRRNLALGFSILALLGSAIAALSIAVRRAHALAEQQRQFMASMSHELRTPLAVIGSAAENLRDGTVDEGLRVREYGTMIHTESKRLGAMLDHALRLAAGRDLRDELRLQPVEVHAVVETAIASFAQELRTRGGQIERAELSDEAGPAADAATVNADPEALRQAIENVLGNALKYGGEPPWVGVRINPVTDPAGPAIEIAIEDRGIGIPPDEVGHVFEPFFRGREPLARQIRGTGLGLALVARVLQAHGGFASVDSAPGRGSVFRLRLPCALAEGEIIPPGRSA